MTKNTEERSAMFLTIVDMLQRHEKAKLKEIAYNADVSITTIHNWRTGKTFAPRINTLIKVSSVLGFNISLTRKRKSNLNLVKMGKR